MLTCLAPFGLALMAAAIKRYPYGGVAHGSPARVMQYLAPSICLLAGLGSATVLGFFRRPSSSAVGVCPACCLVLAAVGVLPLAAEARHPFRSIHAQRAREFAREFWPEFVREAEPVCLRWDLGLGDWDSTNLNVAVYLCNQMIYAPHRRQRWEPRWQDVSEDTAAAVCCFAPGPGGERGGRLASGDETKLSVEWVPVSRGRHGWNRREAEDRAVLGV